MEPLLGWIDTLKEKFEDMEQCLGLAIMAILKMAKTGLEIKKKPAFKPSWDGHLSAFWAGKDPDAAGGHIGKSGKHAFFKFSLKSDQKSYNNVVNELKMK